MTLRVPKALASVYTLFDIDIARRGPGATISTVVGYDLGIDADRDNVHISHRRRKIRITGRNYNPPTLQRDATRDMLSGSDK